MVVVDKSHASMRLRSKEKATPARPDPKGRKVQEHSGNTGVPIPAASLVGLQPDGEPIPYKPERKKRDGLRMGKKFKKAVEERTLQLLGKKKQSEETPEQGAEEDVSSKKKANGKNGKTKKMSGLDAAAAVLAKAGKAIGVQEIVDRAKAKGLWDPKGKTPAATLSAAIGREIKSKGKESRFVKAGRGLFELKK